MDPPGDRDCCLFSSIIPGTVPLSRTHVNVVVKQTANLLIYLALTIDGPLGIEAASNHHIIVLVFMPLAVVFAFDAYGYVMSNDPPELADT